MDGGIKVFNKTIISMNVETRVLDFSKVKPFKFFQANHADPGFNFAFGFTSKKFGP